MLLLPSTQLTNLVQRGSLKAFTVIPTLSELENFLFINMSTPTFVLNGGSVMMNHGSTVPTWTTPLLLSTIAGMSTALGAAIVFVLPQSKSSSERNVSPDVMCFSLSLAGSVMVTISVISLLPEVFASYQDLTFMQLATRIASMGLGCGLYKILSLSFPEPEEILNQQTHSAYDEENARNMELAIQEQKSTNKNPSLSTRRRPISPKSSLSYDNEPQSPTNSNTMPWSSSLSESESEVFLSKCDNLQESYNNDKDVSDTISTPSSQWTVFRGNDLADAEQKKSWRVAMLLFVALLAHNFPEGLAVAASATQSKSLGITVTVGIMIHNIPEGIAIAVPCLRARPNAPWLAFVLASASGLAEPLGAAVTVLVLKWMSVMPGSLENVLAFVAGVMSTVAVCELFPEARRHLKQDDSRQTLASPWSFYGGLLCGFVTMVATELYLQ